MIFHWPSFLCPCSRLLCRLKSFFSLSLPKGRFSWDNSVYTCGPTIIISTSTIHSQTCSSLDDILYSQPIHRVEPLTQFMNFFTVWLQAVLLIPSLLFVSSLHTHKAIYSTLKTQCIARSLYSCPNSSSCLNCTSSVFFPNNDFYSFFLFSFY